MQCFNFIDNVTSYYHQNSMSTKLTAHLYFDKILIANEGGQLQANRLSYIVLHYIYIIYTFLHLQSLQIFKGIHCLLTGISIRNRIKIKKYNRHPKIGNGLVQLIIDGRVHLLKCIYYS